MQKNKTFELIVFDLDGTLMKSDATIYKTMLQTFEVLGIDYHIPYEDFINFIGYHFKDIFDYFNIEVNDIEHFINVYKQRYFNNLMYTELFPKVKETLDIIKNRNIKTAILTTKAQDQLEKIIEYFNMNKYFDLLVGRRPEMKIKPSPEPLLWIINNLKVNPENVLMVGDTELDIECGNKANTYTCYVDYGYGKLKTSKANYSLSYFDKILELL
ncbi:MAG TPA: HAD family hydrolase [Ignavibacteriales bacterium]|nr:HAD family hydrolase [Ignavibacteriales bacterium]HOM65422.1 HAD family hydrolase [Ignavibacteriales bacterium]HRR19487.1 HAD family hydrolase [Ignavibacteriales bacterium]HRT99706.1 HAD family hydrolase [Ignavibacteriales bacterium]